MSQAPATTPVTAVIVTYQSAKTISRALAAAHRCHQAGLLDTVVVDNGSTDATQEVLECEARWARVLLSGHNNGFGRGCNIGFAHVTSPYTIFINPDAVLEPEALQTMLRFMQAHPEVGIAGPAIIEGEYGVDGELQVTGERPTPAAVLRSALPWSRPPALVHPIVPGSEARRTGWVCGAVFMIRTEMLRQLGGFDPRFFLYWEEIDVCKRADDAGYETWALGSAVAHHVGGASTSPDDKRIGGCIAKHYFQSRHHYLRKHHGAVVAAAAELVEFALLAIRASVDAARGRGWTRLQPRLQARLLSLPEEF
jgi:N-acetylglucosaminyl-diphospho-decaprenol L-rhamnosyltransferase